MASRSRDPERTRDKILSQATREFAKRGFDGARVDAERREGRPDARRSQPVHQALLGGMGMRTAANLLRLMMLAFMGRQRMKGV